MKAKILRKERYSTGLNLNLLIVDAPEVLDSLNKLTDKSDIEIEIHGEKVKRSLNANSFFWEIVGRIADKLGASKDEIYFDLLKKYGQSVVVTVRDNVDLDHAGFKYYERFKDGLIGDKKYIAYKMYIGSSQYTKEQMQVLTEGAKSDAAELGILL